MDYINQISGGIPRRALMLAVVASVSVSFLAMASQTNASHVSPTTYSGNPKCSQLIPGTAEVKSEGNGGANGSYTASNGAISIAYSISGAEGGGSNGLVSFSVQTSGQVLYGVFIKGGDGGNLYDYRPAGTTSDSGLHSPANSSGKWAGVSHVSFCYGPAQQSVPTTPPGGGVDNGNDGGDEDGEDGSTGGAPGTPPSGGIEDGRGEAPDNSRPMARPSVEDGSQSGTVAGSRNQAPGSGPMLIPNTAMAPATVDGTEWTAVGMVLALAGLLVITRAAGRPAIERGGVSR